VSAVFVDTSAIYALLVATDAFHPRAREAFARLRAGNARLLTTSYVLVESYALLQRRVGWEAVAAFRDRFAPLLEVIWVGATLHEQGLDDLGRRGATGVSLVDAVSFAAMRQAGADTAFAFDAHFADEGFEVHG
jgi:predicted nucleic acid-binding protein